MEQFLHAIHHSTGTLLSGTYMLTIVLVDFERPSRFSCLKVWVWAQGLL
jgi:hypothetical protein